MLGPELTKAHNVHTGVLGSLDEPKTTTGQPGSGPSDDQILATGGDEVLFVPVGNPGDVLIDGTVSGGTPCKSIFEVLIAERLDTTQAVLQASVLLGGVLGPSFIKLIAQPARKSQTHS